MTSTTGAERRRAAIVATLLFVASAATTVVWCGSMSAMGEMPMPGGWTMSMAWMRMPGQSWPGAAVSFLGMWVVMMVAMMLPSLVPMLRHYQRAIGRTGETRLGWLTALVSVGYFFVWTLVGLVAFPLGVAVAAVEMQEPVLARAVPVTVGAVVLMAGALQLTKWKARQLACCREAPGPGHALPADAGTAWRYGLRLGVHCTYCCAGLTAVLLVLGVMDLRVMAVVTAAVTLERLAPADARIPRAVGAVGVGAGLVLIARATGLGWEGILHGGSFFIGLVPWPGVTIRIAPWIEESSSTCVEEPRRWQDEPFQGLTLGAIVGGPRQR
jgi:predicted metal-binding membrane protein